MRRWVLAAPRRGVLDDIHPYNARRKGKGSVGGEGIKAG